MVNKIDIHGDPDIAAALEVGTVNAINYGTMRSGTSLVFTILCEWFPRNTIVKTHAFRIIPLPHEPKIIINYRDFRDAAVSAWRRHVESDAMMTEEELRHFAAGSQYNAFVLNQYAKVFPKGYFVRYERDIFDVPLLVQNLADYCGVSLIDEEIAAIAARHSIDQHRKESEGVVPMPENAPWMESHVHDGRIGGWKSFTPEPLQGLFTSLLRDDLLNWGYDA